MKPYDKSNSFMRRVTKRVSEYIPGMTWMNTLINDAQTDDDPTSMTENDDQPPVKKLCTSNNSFTNTKYPPTNSTDNHRGSNVNVLLPEISAVTCIPSTSKQSPKFISQLSSSLQTHDVGNRSSLKRKSDVVDLSNINRPSSKTAFNFASSTPTIVTANKQPATINLKRSLNLSKSSTSNEFLTPTSSKLIKSRENESHQQSSLKFHETSANHIPSASFRWDTFVNYGELSERQKLFAQKSPLNCSQVMYGGSSARSSLSKILGNTPPIHRKAVIPISSTNNSEIRTTSSILLEHISTKNKEIEENKFIIQPKVHQRHKAVQKTVPIKIESTVKIVETTPEKVDCKSSEISSNYSGRVDSNTTRKLRVNLSKKGRVLKSDELEMPAEVNLPKVSLAMTSLPSINLSNTNAEDNEFTFNQPLTIEQFSSQFAEKTCRKKQKMTLKKAQNTNIEVNTKDQPSTKSPSTNINISTSETFVKESTKLSATNNDTSIENSNKNEKVPELDRFVDDNSKSTSKISLPCSGSKLESTKSVNMDLDRSPKKLESNNTNKFVPVKSSTEQKKWSCDACWVSNDADTIKCIACQTPKYEKTQTPVLNIIKSVKSSTWTCETCWVPNKNEIEVCVACQTQKPGTTKKTVVQSNTWTCDGCWVKNKSDCTTCISCGTAKPGSASENKPLPSTQFKFGLNNNTFENSGASQFKFGFDSSKNVQPSNQFTFGSAAPFASSDNAKSDTANEFKFGLVNNKADQPVTTFKFGTDSLSSLPVKKLNEDSNINNSDNSETQFKFGVETKPNQPDSQFKFGLSATTNKPTAQFKFGSDKVEIEKSVHQNPVVDNNIIKQSPNEFKSLVNNKNEELEKSLELQSQSNKRKVNDINENCSPKMSFGSVATNSSASNSLVNVGQKNEDPSKEKFVWDNKVKKNEIKPIMNFGSIQPVQSATENTNQLVNGHSHLNETLNEDQKPGLIKTSQLFSFGSLAKPDQNAPVDQKSPKMFTFGSATNDNKSFGSPIMGSSSFPSTAPVFGASNSIFGSGTTTSAPATLGSSTLTPQFSFGSLAPQVPSSFFSKSSNENDKKPLAQTSNSFNSSNVGFSFGAQSPPVFSVPNAGGPIKMSAMGDDQTKCSSINIFNQPSIKPSVKLDPNAPISINFTGGATTQFTAKPETTEPPTKRKILKPVRRIR
ncbi:nuclear pore complex protein Nup153 [Rhopalosiphum maidis]|uniref:nuclear pore complex protein Nup153 n=1 Tax=Rhopalosiphum maidis TaxID=43146 RepID=UPI000EFFE3C9|nr:nuclear pore complex protein Nup153 [Rhopalosiphum maidis]XP_026812257.1 nuclear pore complex protein Nup153 [Rhopalosiphum maidis]XP_026812258.1 nuclear pore complex protein Nup153 [Rhopalosiphum maidis]